jgi:hypothetical protein
MAAPWQQDRAIQRGSWCARSAEDVTDDESKDRFATWRGRHACVVTESELADQLKALLGRLANRDPVRSEATVQADVRQLLLTGGLGLEEHDLDVDLEAPVPGRLRIDVEVGFAVIEVKKDLRSAAVVKQAEKQLAGYVASRADQTGQRDVGILTDGAEWRAYHLKGDELEEATRYLLKPTRPSLTSLLMWLEGVLAIRTGVPPMPREIVVRPGATSASYALDRAALDVLYGANRTLPTVQLKRELWSRLLRSTLGSGLGFSLERRSP